MRSNREKRPVPEKVVLGRSEVMHRVLTLHSYLRSQRLRIRSTNLGAWYSCKSRPESEKSGLVVVPSALLLSATEVAYRTLGPGIGRCSAWPSGSSESEPITVVVVAAVFAGAFGGGVDVGGGGRDIAEAVDELVAPLEELGGFVAGVAGAAGGGEVVFDALQCGGGLATVGVGVPMCWAEGMLSVSTVSRVWAGRRWSAVVIRRSLVLVAAAVVVSQRSCSGWRWSASSTMMRLPSGSFQRLLSRLARASRTVAVVSA